jgi:hypothetical protein
MSAEREPRTWDGTALMNQNRHGAVHTRDDGHGAAAAFATIKAERQSVGGDISAAEAMDPRAWKYERAGAGGERVRGPHP